jgi:hypothetical protein
MRYQKVFTASLVYSFFVTLICMLFYFNLVPSIDKKLRRQFNTCGRYPTEKDITVDNLYWQILSHSKGLVNILNAYLDLRQNKSVVRINVISHFINNSDTFYCQFWFNGTNTPLVVKATDVLQMWSEFVREFWI